MPQLITREDYANLPEDDEECFLAIEEICRRNMDSVINELSREENPGPIWASYMSIVSTAALQCGIHDLSIHPSITNDFERLQKFQEALDVVTTRLHFRNRRRSGPESVQLALNTRPKIEHHVMLLRMAIEKSQLSNERKERLLNKLDELLEELNNRRLRFGRTMAILGTVLVGVTSVGADGPETVTNITAGITSIMRLIGKDKETEEDAVRRLTPPPMALPAPSDPTPEPLSSKRKFGGSFDWDQKAADIDDHIPF